MSEHLAPTGLHSHLLGVRSFPGLTPCATHMPSLRDVHDVFLKPNSRLCKISDFSQEASAYQEKYGQTFTEMKTAYECGEEDFEQYDDLMEWEFAEQGKAYWEKQLEPLKHVL